MFIGIEYVVAAYGIWVGTFVIYVLITKRRMKILNRTVNAIKQRFSESSNNTDKTVSIEN